MKENMPPRTPRPQPAPRSFGVIVIPVGVPILRVDPPGWIIADQLADRG